MKKHMKKIILGIVLVATIAVGGYYIWHAFFSDASHEADPAEGGRELYTLHEQDPISAKGVVTLEVNDSYTFKEDLGSIDTVHVEDGQSVEKGQALFTYRKTTGPEQKAVNEASRQVDALVAQKDRLVARGPATVSVPNDDKNPEAQKAATQANQSAQDEFNSQVADLKAQIDSASAALNDATEALTTTIVAAHPGVVKISEQGRTNAATPFMRITGKEVYIQGSVDQFGFFALGKDRKVTINVDATGQSVEGLITDYDEIPPAQEAGTTSGSATALNALGGEANAPAASAGGNAAHFNFIVRPNEYLQPGFSVELLIHIPGIAIPEESLVKEGDRYFVFVYEEGKANKREINIQRQGLNYVTTDDAFQDGMQIIMHPEGLKDGDDIQAPKDANMEGQMPEEPEKENGKEKEENKKDESSEENE
ncbi:efflux RND transporter periplasmic adaptor subunit [Allofustis seminis]|uniref:efflux RND transporter periplasmic adaptor subunit n=1 Tax=Allofustis seminis TaxID=166939 RepID=UPI00037D25BF|nr:hypothetical protein [Allofustis seminis]